MRDSKTPLDSIIRIDEEDESFSLKNSKEYQNTKGQLRTLCQELNVQPSDYKPDVTVNTISGYLNKSDKLDRILYSEISSYIFGLKENNRANFLTNTERFFLYTLSSTTVTNDVRKIVIKIYDHVQLANRQIENADNIFKNSVKDAKIKWLDEVKGIEREYITILGIFASIVLAFVGGITFTTSILQNIDKVSIYRLILTIDFIGVILANVMYMLMSFIYRINNIEKYNSKSHIKKVNLFGLLIVVLVVLAWLFNIQELRLYIL